MASDHLEREVKLDVNLGFTLPDLNGAGSSGVAGAAAAAGTAAAGIVAHPLPDLRLEATYLDSADLRLARAGVTLRHRSERGGGVAREEWTLKLPGLAGPVGKSGRDDGREKRLVTERRELTWPGDWGSVPPQALRLLTVYRRGAPVAPVARLVTQRRRFALRGPGGEALLEVDDDVVSIVEGNGEGRRFREIEVEVVGDAPAGLMEAVVGRLVAEGAIPGDGQPKLMRALGWQATVPEVCPARPVPIGPKSTVGEVVRAAIADAYLRLAAHDPGVRLGGDDEDVHQARVATRCLRSQLGTFARALPKAWVDETRGDLRWLAAALGAVRDTDVLAQRLKARVAGLSPSDAAEAQPLLARLAAESESHRKALDAVLDSPRYACVLDRLVAGGGEAGSAVGFGGGEAVGRAVGGAVGLGGGDAVGSAVGLGGGEADDGASSSLGSPARRRARGMLGKRWRGLRRSVAALGEEPDDAGLHRVRIRAKRFRYACEALAPVTGKRASKSAKRAAGLQTALGDLRDAAGAEEWLRRAADGATPAEALVIGQLIALEHLEAVSARAAWPAVWRRLDRKALRSWLG